MNNNYSNITKLVLLQELFKSTGLPQVKKLLDDLEPTESELGQIDVARQYSVGRKDYRFEVNAQNRVTSVFFNLNGAGADKNSANIPIRVLDTGNFPFPDLEDNADIERVVLELLDKLNEHPNISSESMLYLAEKYLTTLPVNIVDTNGKRILNDISLFDHISMVLGLLLCIKKCEVAKESVGFLMVGGDISGIQKFIYDIVSKNASRNLKGRSFYLQLLIDSVVQKLLYELELSSANIVYDSGGKFFILAPDIENVRKSINELRKELSGKLWEEHNIRLYLSLDFIELTDERFFSLVEGEGISKYWNDLERKIGKHKLQRYGSEMLTEKGFESFFEAQEEGGITERDSITGEEFDKEEIKEREQERTHKKCEKIFFLNRSEQEVFDPVKRLTFQQVKLGELLPKSKYWLSTEIKIQHPDATKEDDKNIEIFNPCEMGIYHYFLKKEQLKTILDSKENEGINFRILQFNNTDFELFNAENYTYGFTFYGGNQLPEHQENSTEKDEEEYKKGDTKTFSQLAGKGDFKRLGFLRMDIDNLGQIFVSGLQGQRTFSRYKALSRNLDYFFKGYLNKIWETDKYRDHTYILYSGGDDLFILGRWDKVLDMAQEIRGKFNKWVCKNPNLTLSGGMTNVTHKFPTIQAASLAEDAEKAAKAHKYKVSGSDEKKKKNAFYLFDTALDWDIEFEIVKYLKNKLLNFIETEQFHKSIINKINYYRDLQDYESRKDINPSWYWLLLYDFSQYARNRKKKHQEAIDFVHEMKNDAVQNKFNNGETDLLNKDRRTYLHLLNLAARWADFEIRTKNKDKK